MEKEYRKPALIAAIVIAIVIVLALITGAGEKFGRFVTILGNVSTNLANPTHGDTRDLSKIDAEFIKTETGSTNLVSESMLPKALRPIKEYGHPPFTLGACQVCHAPTRSKPAAILTKSVDKLCYNCHIPVAQKKPLDCNKCHNPHHSDKEKLLRQKVTERECPIGDFEE